MKKKFVLISLLIAVLMLSACAKAATTQSATDSNSSLGYSRDSVEAPATMEMAATAKAPLPSSTGSMANSSTEIQQMIVMNASLEIAVDDPGTAMSDIQKMASDMGGFTVSSYIYWTYGSNAEKIPAANITVRVPAEKLDAALDQIKALTGDAAKYTLSENISGQDVTQDYTDLQSRLRNLEEANAKLSELYDTATKTEDALAIYQQKLQVTEQIEVIKGQMQYYEQASAKSAITVQITAKESIAPITIGKWQPVGVARDAVQALINFGKGLANFLIWLVILIVPIAIVIGLPIFFFVRWLVRRNRRKQAARLEELKKQQPPLPIK